MIITGPGWIEEMEVNVDEVRLHYCDENGRECWQPIFPGAAIDMLEKWREDWKKEHELATRGCQHSHDDLCDCQFKDVELRDALESIDVAIRDLQTRK